MVAVRLWIVLSTLAFCGDSALAESRRLLLRSGLILTSQGFVRASNVFSVRGAPNLVLVNGRLMERDPRFRNVFRPLGINSDTNQLAGASRSGTLGQVGRVLQSLVDRVQDPEKRALFDRFLRANGFAGSSSADPGGVGRSAVADGNHPAGGGSGGSGTDASPVARAVSGDLGGNGQKFDPSGTLGAEGCRNMAGAICGGNDGAGVDQAAESQERALLTRFASQARQSPNSVFSSARALTQGRDNGIFRSYVNFLQNNLPPFDSAVDQIRQELMDTIDVQSFSASTKIQLKGELARQRFLLTPPLNDPEGVRVWLAACSPTGFATNAFAAIRRGFVVICPGFLAGVAGSGTGSLTDRLRMVITHELTHQIGADRTLAFQPNHFGRLAACFVNNFPGVIPSQSAEITADAMAADSVGLKLIREGLKGQAALDVIRAGLKPLCRLNEPTPPDGEHPSNRFRIESVAGRNPRILAAVCGIQPTTDRPSCTTAGLEGTQNKNSFLADTGQDSRLGATSERGDGHALGFKSEAGASGVGIRRASLAAGGH